MIGYVAQRLWQAVFVLLVVAVVAFVMFKYLGDPLVAILGSDSTAEQRARVRIELGLDRPIVVQFAQFVARAAVGDFDHMLVNAPSNTRAYARFAGLVERRRR